MTDQTNKDLPQDAAGAHGITEEAREVLQALADDLECVLNDKYSLRDNYPSIARDWDLDMLIVRQARALLAKGSQNPIKTESRASACDRLDGGNAIKKASTPAAGSALSDAEIVSLAYDCNALPECITDKTLLVFARAILAQYGSPARSAAEQEIIEAARNLVKVKGRHHGELAYKRLADAVASAPQESK